VKLTTRLHPLSAWKANCWICIEWSEVSYGEVFVDKRDMYIRVTLYCGHSFILWLFYLGISCTVFVLICTVVVLYCFVVCVCVCVCGFSNVCVCVGVLVICILYSHWGFYYPDWGFSVLFPWL
jgi:hypothetical protein